MNITQETYCTCSCTVCICKVCIRIQWLALISVVYTLKIVKLKSDIHIHVRTGIHVNVKKAMAETSCAIDVEYRPKANFHL